MKHFTLEQFNCSTTAKQRGIDNSVPPEYKSHAENLVNKILDPLIDAWGSKVIMTSGYRCYELNKTIGGSTTSAHSYAYAADLVPANGKIEEFKTFAMQWLLNNNILFDQYINEYSGKSSWVHIGFKNGKGEQRKQYLLYKNGKYTTINPTFYKGVPDISDAESGNNGSLTGKSVYLKDINLAAIKKNDIFLKDDSGEPLLDENGDFIISDDYLFNANESESDAIEDASEFPAEPIELDLSSIELKSVEQVKGISYNSDGSWAVSHSKTIQEILAMVQQWWDAIQTLKKIDFKHIDESLKSMEATEVEDTIEKYKNINAMVYMKGAFDTYGHALREGMKCPVCGKTVRFLPPGGYCSPECLLKAAKDKSLAFLRSPSKKYEWLKEIVNQLSAVLDLTNMLLNLIVMIPDIIRDLAKLPEEYKEYCRLKIAEGFAELQELIQKAMVKKNDLTQRMLKPIDLGIFAKPVLMAMTAIAAINHVLEVMHDTFMMVYDVIMEVINYLTKIATMTPGLKLPAESFAWALTPRSFMSTMPYTCPDMGKIFVVLPGGSGVPMEGLKPLLPSALESINMQAIDAVIQSMFPPLTPLDFYLPPDLFQVRYLFSDQSDLVTQLRQKLEDLLKGGPDYIPNFENLLPVKTHTIAGIPIPLPNLGYVWFLLGLMDAWAPHSQALVGSMLNPLV